MSDSTLNSCKTALGNMIASDKIQEADNPLEAFTEGIQNFLAHYCHDQHTSSWCYHPKVICLALHTIGYKVKIILIFFNF